MIDYYSTARLASSSYIGHPGLEFIFTACKSAKLVLDAGCGEGTRLNTYCQTQIGYGIDINVKAISLAKDQYPRHKFQVSQPNHFPFKDNFFDLVYSAFVLEHTQNPDMYISELIRVTKPGGLIVIISPNFGAPNRRSPNSTQNPIIKLLNGPRSSWQFVNPKKDYNAIDDDTSVEPYIELIISRLNLCKILLKSSLWSLEPASLNPRKLIIKWLGQLNLPPFKNWGPQIFIAAQKK